MAEIMRLTAYELERTLTLPRTALVFGILVAIVQASLAVIDTVAMQQAYEGASVLSGATAFDTFYMALNVEASTALPIACISSRAMRMRAAACLSCRIVRGVRPMRPRRCSLRSYSAPGASSRYSRFHLRWAHCSGDYRSVMEAFLRGC